MIRILLRLAAVMALGAAASVILGLIWPQLRDNLPFQIMLGVAIGLSTPSIVRRRGGGR